VLDAAPTADVTVTIDGLPQLTGAPSPITFTPANWNIPQTVTVTAVDDLAVEGSHTGTLTHAMASADGNYNGLAGPSVLATIGDNDNAGIAVTPTGGGTNVVEGGATDKVSYVLTAQPMVDVTITLATNSQLEVSPTTLTFTNANWNIPLDVTVTAIDDHIDEDDPHTGVVNATAASSDPGWAAMSVPQVLAYVGDNDEAGIVFEETDDETKVSEDGDTDFVNIRLNSQPSGEVTISLTPDKQVKVSKQEIDFNASDWDKTVEVEISAVDDGDVEGDHLGIIVTKTTSNDSKYGAVSGSLEAKIKDNDKDDHSLPVIPDDTKPKQKIPKAPKIDSTSSGATDSAANKSSESVAPESASSSDTSDGKGDLKGQVPSKGDQKESTARSEQASAVNDKLPKKSPETLGSWAKDHTAVLASLAGGLLALMTILGMMMRDNAVVAGGKRRGAAAAKRRSRPSADARREIKERKALARERQQELKAQKQQIKEIKKTAEQQRKEEIKARKRDNESRERKDKK
jgi:hypothetical protein